MAAEMMNFVFGLFLVAAFVPPPAGPPAVSVPTVGTTKPAAAPGSSQVLVTGQGGIDRVHSIGGRIYWVDVLSNGMDNSPSLLGRLDLKSGARVSKRFDDALHGLVELRGQLYGFSGGCTMNRISLSSGKMYQSAAYGPFPCIDPVSDSTHIFFSERGGPLLFSLPGREPFPSSSRIEGRGDVRTVEPLMSIVDLLVDQKTVYLSGFSTTKRSMVARMDGWQAPIVAFAEWPGEGERLSIAQNRDLIFLGPKDRAGDVFAFPKRGGPPRRLFHAEPVSALAATEKEVFAVTSAVGETGGAGELRAWKLDDGTSQVLCEKDARPWLAVVDGRLYWVRQIPGAHGLKHSTDLMVTDRR